MTASGDMTACWWSACLWCWSTCLAVEAPVGSVRVCLGDGGDAPRDGGAQVMMRERRPAERWPSGDALVAARGHVVAV